MEQNPVFVRDANDGSFVAAERRFDTHGLVPGQERPERVLDACMYRMHHARMHAGALRQVYKRSFVFIIFFAVRRGDNPWAQRLRVCAVVRKGPWWSSL